ncbi:hypothetical protein [Kineosporia succinea]|uniref:DUF4288 domain-containing protein n=1 Tax=Kineosporia succinea TaxID=84632 RepID=A0ABT9P992_9ACTN|nr:hypothetical protein [Kineosporia succinea]MDP9829266.1 hypothetical protein [Kineosporia succinea]
MSDTWFGVRCLFRLPDLSVYEERVTVWNCDSSDAAIAAAEEEAREYAETVGGGYVGLAQSYALFSAPEHGSEVFSLMRTSDRAADDYVERFFVTGDEHQGTV